MYGIRPVISPVGCVGVSSYSRSSSTVWVSGEAQKDLVLLRALPEPANVAACGRAGHSMLVWYRPLVLEKKSSSAH